MDNKERALEMYKAIEKRKEAELKDKIVKKKSLTSISEVSGKTLENNKFSNWSSYRVRSGNNASPRQKEDFDE